MIISHNMSAMNAQRQFGINTKEKSKSADTRIRSCIYQCTGRHLFGAGGRWGVSRSQ